MQLPSTMRAVEVTSFDGPTAMRIVDRPVPRPGTGEALIKVLAAGVNFADAMQTRGTYLGGPKPPFFAGFEACGEIVAVGDGAVPWAVGAKVIAFGPGAFADYGVAGGKASITNEELLFKYPVQLIGLNMAIQSQLMGAIFPELGKLIAEKVIDPAEPTGHPLAHAPRVVSEIEARKTMGKHVLVP